MKYKPLPETPKRRLLTVAMEDYFQVATFRKTIQRGQWYRFESRLEQNTERTLALLERHDIKATFFVLGWLADRFPELVRRVADRGHEVATKGYYHRGVGQMPVEEFRDELLRSREVLERASGKKVVGYRMADGWFRREDLWALDVLAELGFAYDSSICPIGRRFADERWRRVVHRHRAPSGPIWEFPISCANIWGWGVPIGGGNYFRQVPERVMRRAVERWHSTHSTPLVMYYHLWELDPEQPRISAAGKLARVRHYRRLDRMEWILKYYFENYSFTSIADYLELDTRLDHPAPALARIEDVIEPAEELRRDRTPVTVVIPCYNEEDTLPYLKNTLASAEKRLRPNYDVTFCMVDDGSKDGTWKTLQKLFGQRPQFRLIPHERNQGVAAAILTGIRAAETDIVCSMDADCTYDPHELADMIPLLADDIDMVTASPYHREGGVRNIPAWRLTLSKGVSWMYRRVLRSKLATYTSCFRVYRKSAVEDLPVREKGFAGVAEMLGQLDLQGGRIVEFPSVLDVRIIGQSKMRPVGTMMTHLKLLARLLRKRLGKHDDSNQIVSPRAAVRGSLEHQGEHAHDCRNLQSEVTRAAV